MTYPEQPPAAGQPNPVWPPNPAQPNPAAPPPAAAPPAKSTRRVFWTRGPGVIVLVFAVGLVIVGLAAALGAFDPKKASAGAEVKVVSCTVGGSDELQTAKVGLTVKNTGDTTRSFRIGVEYRDGAGNRVDTDTATVRSVKPGDIARTEESTILDAPVSSGTCTVTSVR